MTKKLLLFILLVTGSCYSQEVCNNAIDDDGDGLIDINDPDCICNQSNISSLIANASFEQHEICPQDFGLLQFCTGWDQITNASTDYLNTCDYVCPAAIDAGLVPFPNGQGCVSGYIHTIYKEYIGRCLTSPLQSGVTYQITFNIAAIPVRSGDLSKCTLQDVAYDPIYITIYGSPNCTGTSVPTYLHPNDTDPSWVKLGSAYYNPSGSWGELTITFSTTTEVNAFMLGAPEDLPPSYIVDSSVQDFCSPYFFYDNLILNEASVFGATISSLGNYCTGEMILTANPAIPLDTSVTYQWYKEGIAIIGATNPTYTVLSGGIGNYAVRITNGGNCYVSSSFKVSDIMLGPAYTVAEPTCYANGNITIATSADLYSFDNGATWAANATKSNLPPGTYYVKVKYNSGCVSAPSTVTLQVPAYLPAPLYTVQDATCGPTGSITITSPAAEFSFDGGETWGTSPTLQNVIGGYYKIRLKNAAGCASFVAEVYVDQDFLGEPTTTVINAQCADNGIITVTSVAAEYSFDGGETWQTNPMLDNLAPGLYSVVVKDAGGCISKPKFVSVQQILASAAAQTQNAGCGNNGSITIVNPAVEYSIDGGDSWQTSPLFSNLEAGQYTIAFKYPEGCVSNMNIVTLYETLLNYAPQATVVSADCDPGSITITTAGSEYSFDGGITWRNTPTLSGLSAGSYVIMIKDTAGCKSQKKTIIVPSNPGALADPQYNVTSSLCDDNGSITVTTPAAEYSFDNGATWGTSNTALSLAPGNYTIKIKSATGCESAGVNVIVLQDIVPVPETSSVEYCQDAVALALTATGSDLLWYITQTGGIGSTTAPTPSTVTTGITTYYVSQVVNGCESGRIPLVVTILPIPTAPIAEDELLYCEGSSTVPLTATGTNLLWYTDENGIGSATAPTPSSSVTGTFTYYVSQSNNGCESEKTAITVIIKPTPLMPVTDNLINYELGDVAEMLTASGQNLTWYDHNNTLLPNAPTPNTTVIGATTYYVTQTINGCESSAAEIQVVVAPNYVTIKFPNYFTPNGDTYHDTWNVFNPGKGIKVITYIFDRYGKLLTSVKSPGAGWDGTFNGHDLPASDYWFMATYEEFGMQKEVKAHFSLMR